jgi:O-antigen ligase
MSEWVGNLHIPGDRMSGIAGSPNGLGGLASSALLLIYLYKTKLSNGSLLKLMLMTTIILVCLVASNSRSALGILLLSIYIHILLNNTKIFALITILVLAASNVILLVGVEEFLSSVSRSASAADLATGTGRTLIWSTVLRLSSERPIFGWGFGSSIEILPKQPELFALAAHAHNMYLQILLTVGFVGLFLFVLANLFVFRSAVLSGDHKMLSIFAFHQLIGLTESGTVGSLAGMTYVHYLIPFVCLNLHCQHSSSDFTRKARLQ